MKVVHYCFQISSSKRVKLICPIPHLKEAMNSICPRLVVEVDLKKRPWEQNPPLHNRSHPEIPPVAEVRVGEVFRVEMVDFSGGGVIQETLSRTLSVLIILL